MTNRNKNKATAIARKNAPNWMVFSIFALAAILTVFAGVSRV